MLARTWKAQSFRHGLGENVFGPLYDTDIEFFNGTLYSCREEYEMGTEPHFTSKAAARRYASEQEVECDPLIEETGVWVRVTKIGYDLSWHGPFDTHAEAEKFVEHVWNPKMSGYKMDDDLDGVQKQLPAWVRR